MPSETVVDTEQVKSYRDRRSTLIDFFADRETDDYCGRIGAVETACRMYRGDPPEQFAGDLERFLDHPHGDMFWMLPATLLHYCGRKIMPPHLLRNLEDTWRSYTPYRGDTENHWLMYYASMYLMTQALPDRSGIEWFNGRSSEENFREAQDYLMYWMELAVSHGLNEFDSPHYLPFYLAPLSLLYKHSADMTMSGNARCLLDLLITDFASNTLNGIYAGAHSRVYPEPMLQRYRNGSNTFSWLLFGNTVFSPDALNIVLQRPGYRPHGAAVYLALSGYEPDEIVYAAATIREAPYLHRTRKRSRKRIRRHKPSVVDVCKTTFVCSDYAVGSIDGGLVQPVQQHSWEVQWAENDERVGYNLLFCLHPYWSEEEMAAFFPEEPQLLADRVVNSEKPTYTSENKWTCGSPFQQILQDRDAVIVLFDIPDGVHYPHVDAYFSRALTETIEDDSGWIVVRGGDALIGYYPLAPWQWIDEPGGDRRLRSQSLKNGAVVQVAPASGFKTTNEFVESLRARIPEFRMHPSPSVRYRTLRGSEMHFVYGGMRSIDGEQVRYDRWPLYEGPFITGSDPQSITLTANDQTRTLNFRFGPRSE